MKFLSDIGRPWTLGEMNRAIGMYRDQHGIGYIATLLNRSVEEIKRTVKDVKIP